MLCLAKQSLKKITSSMWVEMSVFGLGLWLVYDHASRWKLRNRYMIYTSRWYLTMLMLPAGWNLRRMLRKSLALAISLSSNNSSKVNFKVTHTLSSYWLSLVCRRPLHNWVLVFTCFNSIIWFQRILVRLLQGVVHDRVTQRNINLHSPKLK